MGIQILNKDVSVISRVTNIAKANIGSIFGKTGWSGGGGGPASQGPLANLSTLYTDSSVGNVDWTINTTTSATTNTLFQSDITYYVIGQGFGFSIPTGATINGIIVTLDAQVNDGSARDYSAMIVKNDIITGNDKSVGAYLNVGSYANKTFGSSSDLWGETWSASDINYNKFGFAYAVEYIAATKIGEFVSVKDIKITVHYTT